MAHTNVVEKGKIYQDPATQEALRASQPGYRELQGKGEGAAFFIRFPKKAEA